VLRLYHHQVKPKKYTLRHGYTSQGHAMRNWDLLGSEDGKQWDLIKRHVDDMTMGDQKKLQETASWDLSDVKSFYSYFKIKITGNSSSGTDYLMMGGCEIYGTLKML